MRNEVLYDRGYLVHYEEGDSSLHRTPINYIKSVTDIYHVVKEGESLLEIAKERYGSQFLWYIIADTNINQIDDIFQLTTGMVLLIPNLDVLDAVYG